jgi:hypothetical protein
MYRLALVSCGGLDVRHLAFDRCQRVLARVSGAEITRSADDQPLAREFTTGDGSHVALDEPRELQRVALVRSWIGGVRSAVTQSNPAAFLFQLDALGSSCCGHRPARHDRARTVLEFLDPTFAGQIDERVNITSIASKTSIRLQSGSMPRRAVSWLARR